MVEMIRTPLVIGCFLSAKVEYCYALPNNKYITN